MRQFFEPAESPIWLKRVLFSIRDGLSDVWATALRLKDYTTAGLPPAADWKQGLVYDSTTVSVKFSDGTNWTGLSAAGHTHTETDILLGATDRLVGRDTAGAGAAEELTVGGGIEFTGTGGIQTSAFTGDVTKAAGGTAQTIPNDTVTYAKMQNVSATDKVLGRSTAGAGDVEEIACTAAGRALIDDADAAAQRTTLGLGTAAVKNTGTSGDAVPILNGAATTWAAGATFGGVVRTTGILETGGSCARFESTAGPPTGSAGLGLEIIGGDGSSSLIQSYNRTTATYGNVIHRAATIVFSISGTTVMTTNNTGPDLASGIVLKVAGTTVVGARKTGWSTATGTATRTTFDTATVTTAQLAERVKALIDDLHGTAGHGLIGT